jgi:hypothetical protein
LHDTFSPSKRDSENKAEYKQTTERKFTKPSQTNKQTKTKAKGRIKDHLHRKKKLHKIHHKKSTVTLEPNKRLKAPCDGRETRISFFFFFLFFFVGVFDKTTTEFCLLASTANVS